MWIKLLDTFLTHLFRSGELTVTYPDGHSKTYGDGKGDIVALTLHDPALPRKLIISPEMAVGEAYMDETLTIQDDDLRGFLNLAVNNMANHGRPWFHRPLEAYRYIHRYVSQFNPAKKSKSNVAHHYDLSGDLYDLFLDEDRQYSCAYFTDPDMSLEEAQLAKKRHIAAKLRLEPGMRVLDIGCGWGGMGLMLARDYGVEVVGVTLSEEQHALANKRAADAGLSDKVKFELMDYRHVTGKFDRIVSVGMFEHVGVLHYNEYFKTVRQLLTEDGIALIHTIGRCDEPGVTNPWILKYIFPGGYCPALSETTNHIENNDFHFADIEVWRTHYAHTLRHWHDRFMANIDKAEALYDAKFCRMWRFYLIACEVSFWHQKQVVYQFQISPNLTAVPVTRDYLYADDRKRMQHAAE
ncbi:MAG: cyclopropane-fatty-acyl-phospholipid synthase family protein [Pseudomonadota bacterium]